MNCVHCNNPLEANSRFCRNCGLPVTNPTSTPETNANGGSGKASASPLYQPVSSHTDAPTVPPTPWQAPPQTPQQQPLYLSGQPGQSAPASSAPTQQAQQWPQQQNQQQAWRPAPSQPSPFAQSDQRYDAGTMRSGSPNQPQKRRKRRGRGLLIGLAIFIVLIVVLLIGARLVLNAYAISQINQASSDAINKIPSAVAILPDRDQTIPEGAVNALISLKSSSFSPVQNLAIHFTPNDMEIDFNVFSFSSTITTVPKIVNGKFVVTNTTVQGIAGLILSPDDITNLINNQITNLETHIQHTITAVTLQNQAIVLHFKRSTSIPITPPALPTSGPPTLPTGAPTGLPTLPPAP